MSGSSLDGLDAALVRCFGSGLSMTFERVVASVSWELGPSSFLRDFASGRTFDAFSIAEGARRLGESHADAVAALLEQTHETPELIAVHGQTVVDRGPIAWRLIDPWAIAARTGAPVVSDLRTAELPAGTTELARRGETVPRGAAAPSGHGASVMALADWVMFRDPDIPRVVVDLGRFAGATVIPAGAGPEHVRGFDVCACNRVLDAAARVTLDLPFDDGGARALAGAVDGRCAGDLRDMIEAQASAGRALGAGDECVDWVARWATKIAPEDLLATAARTIGSVVGLRVRAAAGADAELIVAGGGAHNRALVESIGGASPAGSLGVEPHEREPAAMAVLGLFAGDGVAFPIPRQSAGQTAGENAGDKLGEGAVLTGSWVNVRPALSRGGANRGALGGV